MKVVHFIWSANIGGIERLVIDLAKVQNQSGLQASVAIGKDEGTLLNEIQQNNIPFFCCQLKTGLHMPFLRIQKIVAYLKTFDCIHIHTFNPFFFTAAILSGKKIVYHEHGNWVSGREETLADKLKKKWLQWYINWFTTALLFNSAFTKNKIEQFYNFKIAKQQVIHNGIVIGNYNLPNLTTSNHFIVVTVGRLAWFKRFDRVIETFALFAKNKKDIALHIIGDGPLKKELYEQVEKLKITEQVRFEGYQTNVLERLAEADVCVFGSENEPFGLVLIEALSVGKTCLVFDDAGGMKEILEQHDKNMIATDIQAMAKKLNCYYEHRPTKEQEESNKSFAKRFDIAIFASKINDIYKEVLA